MTATQNLINAIRKNNIDDVLTALKNGANVNAEDGYQSILDIAIQNDNPKIVSLLLKKGKTKIYQSSLHKALFMTFQNEKREMARLVVSHIEDTSIGAAYNPTFLNAAIQLNWPEVLDKLLEKDFKLKEKERFGKKLYHEAVYNNSHDCVKILLKHKADMHDFYGSTNALHIAAQFGRTKILETLIDAGGDINKTPLCFTDGLKILAMLSTGFLYIPDPTPQNKVIHVAAQDGEVEIIDLLMKKCKEDVKIDEPGDENKPPLIQAIEQGHYQAARRLLEYGADPNVQDDIGTSLHAAVRNNDYELIQLLFEYGADQRLTGKCKKTPLQYAKYLQENNCISRDDCINELEKAWKIGSSIAKQKPYYRKGFGKNNERGS